MHRVMLLLLLLAFVLPLHAQDDDPPLDHPLIDLLQLALDDERSAFTYYFDFAASEAARDYIPQIDTVEQWQTLLPPVTAYTGRWFSLPDVLNQGVLFNVARVPDVMGFDFFAVDRVLGFGAPPAGGVVWGLDYDAQSVIDAHTARGYTEATRGDLALLCGPQGCDAPPEVDFNAADQANLFDPSLGRAFPVALLDDALVSAGTIATLDQINAGDVLYNTELYQRATDALIAAGGEDAALVQAQFVPSGDFVRRVVDFDEPDTVSEIPDVLQGFDPNIADFPMWAQGYSYLPPFDLLAFGDFQDGDEQVAVLVIMPTTGLDAVLIAFELEQRLMAFTDRMQFGGNATVLDRFDGALQARAVGEDEDTIVVVTVRYPNPPEDEEIEAGNDIIPAQIYRIWTRALATGGFYPLWDVALP
jgi:hypothetical protein